MIVWSNLKVSFNSTPIKFKTFKEYAELYADDVFYERSENWEIGVAHSQNGHKQISFVNTVETKDGGTHVNYILNQIVEKLKVILKKKHKVEIKPSDIKNHMLLFVNCAVVNSGFSSQTKEKLITEVKEFGTSHEVSDKLIKQIFDSEIIKSILDNMRYNSIFNSMRYDFNVSIKCESTRKALEALWSNLPKYALYDTLPIIDVSGSMTGFCHPHSTFLPIHASVGLGIYAAENLSGDFKNSFITFSSNPTFVEFFDDDTVTKKVQKTIDIDKTLNKPIEKSNIKTTVKKEWKKNIS